MTDANSPEVIAMVHAIDDLDKLQHAVKRTTRESLHMLEMALHALRNDRSSVTDEYIERVIGYLTELRAKS